MFRRHRQGGATLLELIVSIVVISIGLAGVLVVMDRNTRASADPVIRHQAVAIAEAYLEEILLKDFCDPNNANPCTPGNAPGNAASLCFVCPVAEVNRVDFDNVCDYNGRTDNGARDQLNAPIAGLGGYTVQTNVSTNGSLGALTGGACEVLQVDVSVTPPSGPAIALSGFRTNFR